MRSLINKKNSIERVESNSGTISNRQSNTTERQKSKEIISYNQSNKQNSNKNLSNQDSRSEYIIEKNQKLSVNSSQKSGKFRTLNRDFIEDHVNPEKSLTEKS